MITPVEIQSKAFKSGIGYDKKDVDSFINEILENSIWGERKFEPKVEVVLANDVEAYFVIAVFSYYLLK